MAAAVAEVDGDDLKLVDVLEVLADRGLGVAGVVLAHDEVAGCAVYDALCEVLVQVLEAVRPTDVNLDRSTVS